LFELKAGQFTPWRYQEPNEAQQPSEAPKRLKKKRRRGRRGRRGKKSFTTSLDGNKCREAVAAVFRRRKRMERMRRGVV
jgi:hypothetical protein